MDVEPILVTQIDTTCRITCMSLWTGSQKIPAEESDVKPITDEVPNESRTPNGTKLKSLLKRASTDNEISIVMSTSGPFIVEPLKKRYEKRPRLTFGGVEALSPP